MRRTALILAVAAIAAASFAAGQAAKLKFPWAGDILNGPCGKTLLEWKCQANAIRCEPLKPTKEWRVTHLYATLHQRGVLVRANITRTPGHTDGNRARWLHRAKESVYREAKSRFAPWLLPPKDAKAPFQRAPALEWDHCRVEVYVDGKAAEAKGMKRKALGRQLVRPSQSARGSGLQNSIFEIRGHHTDYMSDRGLGVHVGRTLAQARREGLRVDDASAREHRPAAG